MALHLFAGLRVRDLQAARPWYERLFGEPSYFPNDTEAVWTLGDGRSVYVVEHAAGAGHSVVTIFLDDLDAHAAAVAARGLQPSEWETYANGVRKAVYRDPEGNELRCRRRAARLRLTHRPARWRSNARVSAVRRLSSVAVERQPRHEQRVAAQGDGR